MNFIIPHFMFPTSLVSSMRTAVTFSYSVLLLVTCTTASAEDTNSPSPQDIEFFEKKIRPVLAARCYSCHSNRSKTVKGSLKVDSRGALIAGGDSGSAIVPGKPEESLLIAAIQFKKNADVQMPPKGKLPDHEIAALTEWVRRGAPFPGGTASTPQGERKIDFAEARKFWSFVPVEQKPLPRTKQTAWAKRRIDHFVLAAMETNGLSPSKEADRATLLRRLTFDLTGLPPTP
ncbi:MAG: DUF1549 domain-containing protein, partial [Pseudomonadales bacterium]|nr:DUF1549 domain-containing protein [Pseudomonadales bacterium]